MEISPLQQHSVNAADLPLDRLASSTKVSEPEKVAQVSRAFEAILLRQVLSETQQPVFKSKYVGNSATDGIYRDLVVNQLAENISKSGGLGLASSLTCELQRQSGAVKAAAPQPSATRSAGVQTSNHD